MARLNLKADGKNQEILLDYLEKNASEPLAEKINAGVKTLAGCWTYIRGEARKQAMNGVAVIEDAEVFGWAVHYFEEDDIKEGKTSSYTQTPEQLRKMAVDEEQRTKEIERRNAERREAEERRKAEEAKKIAEAEAKRKEQREKAAQRAAEAAERQRKKEEEKNKAVAGQFSMFDLFGTEV